MTERGMVRWIDDLQPTERAVLFVAALGAMGWLFYGRQGLFQWGAPFPTGSLEPGWHADR